MTDEENSTYKHAKLWERKSIFGIILDVPRMKINRNLPKKKKSKGGGKLILGGQ